MEKINDKYNSNLDQLAKANNLRPSNTIRESVDSIDKISSKVDFIYKMGLDDLYFKDPNIQYEDMPLLEDYSEILVTRSSLPRDVLRPLIKKSGSNSRDIQNYILNQMQALGKRQTFVACFGSPPQYLEAVDPFGRVYKDTYGIRRDELWGIKTIGFRSDKSTPSLFTSNTDTKTFTAYIKVGIPSFSKGRMIGNHATNVINGGQSADKKQEEAKNKEELEKLKENKTDGEKKFLDILTNGGTNNSIITSFALTYFVNENVTRQKDDKYQIWSDGKIVPFNRFMYRAIRRSLEEHSSDIIQSLSYVKDTGPASPEVAQLMDYLNKRVYDIFGDGSYPFFKFICTSESVINDSYQNVPGQSTVHSLLEKSLGYAREWSFMSGGGDAIDFMGAIGAMMKKSVDNNKAEGQEKSFVDSILETVGGFTYEGIRQAKSAANNIIGSDFVDMYLKGNSLIYPQVWTGSSIIRTITLQMRLYSAYGDFVSIYLNILLPFLTILGFSLPRQTSPSFITFPFLYSIEIPGLAQSTFAMTQTLTIRRGGRFDAWTDSSLMRGIDITLDVIPLKPMFGLPEEIYTGKFQPGDIEPPKNIDPLQDPSNKIYGRNSGQNNKGDITFANELRNMSGSFIISDQDHINDEWIEIKKAFNNGQLPENMSRNSYVRSFDDKTHLELYNDLKNMITPNKK